MTAVAATGVISVIAAAPATAESGNAGDVSVINTETVQVYASANGTPDTKRVYEQLALSGKGNVDLSNPIATSGLRNLDGFGGLRRRGRPAGRPRRASTARRSSAR